MRPISSRLQSRIWASPTPSQNLVGSTNGLEPNGRDQTQDPGGNGPLSEWRTWNIPPRRYACAWSGPVASCTVYSWWCCMKPWPRHYCSWCSHRSQPVETSCSRSCWTRRCLLLTLPHSSQRHASCNSLQHEDFTIKISKGAMWQPLWWTGYPNTPCARRRHSSDSQVATVNVPLRINVLCVRCYGLVIAEFPFDTVFDLALALTCPPGWPGPRLTQTVSHAWPTVDVLRD